MVLGTRFVNFFVEYLPVLFSDSGARDQRVCLRMGQVDRKLSRELSEGESDSIPSCSILWSGSVAGILNEKAHPYQGQGGAGESFGS